MNSTVLQCKDVSRFYASGPEHVQVLEGLNLEITAGESIAVRGVSGSGKSTLLNILGGLDDPSSGQVLVNGQLMAELNESARARLRNRSIGYVYQFHHLLPEFSALENVAMPLLLRGEKRSVAAAAASEILSLIGLENRGSHRPSELSGGERQRVAIARALVTKPLCVLMDEPTGNLDPDNASRTLDLVAGINRLAETAVVLVTHDDQVAQRMDRRLRLQDGRLEPEE
jgi:lipoprotein-releasing system ATP-binding protein